MKPEPAETALRPGGLALWRQIVQALESEINDGTRPPGTQLPTEAQLATRFAVNRHTVRRALEELSHNGLVRVEQGRGSFVAEDVLDYAVSARTRFSETIRRHNREPSGRVLDLREIAADKHIAAGLGIRAGGRVIRMERLGLADGRPVSLGNHHFPAARFPGLLDALRRSATISEALVAVGVPDYRRLVTRITARLPQPHESALLATPRNRPLLVTENVNVDQAGAIIEFGIGLHPTPRVQIVIEP
jgi:GntR family phosphonate transport system transcriptional regulator